MGPVLCAERSRSKGIQDVGQFAVGEGVEVGVETVQLGAEMGRGVPNPG